MHEQEIERIVETAAADGWVLEPEAKRMMACAGLSVPMHNWATTAEGACLAAATIGYPVVAKVVSPAVIHKSDVGGVAVGILDEGRLMRAYRRFAEMDRFTGMLVEEMVSGVELIVGAKVDYQFGPVILLGVGGTGVEIYGDAVIRMAPLSERDVDAMVAGLKARRLLEGFRGSPPVDKKRLTRTLVTFSELVMTLGDRIEAIDLNPVMCTPNDCVVADARIMLASGPR